MNFAIFDHLNVPTFIVYLFSVLKCNLFEVYLLIFRADAKVYSRFWHLIENKENNKNG